MFNWVKKIFKKKEKAEFPVITFNFDCEKEIIYIQVYWPQNIDKTRFVEKYPIMLTLLQNGSLNNLICDTIRSYGVKSGDLFTANTIADKVTEVIHSNNEAWLDEPVVLPNEVFPHNN